jgi:c-di-GMP-related signal transduction protein
LTAPHVHRRRCSLVSASLKGSQRLIGELRLGCTGEVDEALAQMQRDLHRLLRVVSAIRRGKPVHAERVVVARRAA